jgi:thiol-disulfide isomerase/thioredoxin
MRVLRAITVLFVFAAAALAVAQTAKPAPVVAPKAPPALAGQWYAHFSLPTSSSARVLTSFPFAFLVERSHGVLSAKLVNGREAEPFSRVEWKDGVLRLYLDHYEGELTLQLEGDTLAGEYTRASRRGKIHYPVTASRKEPSASRPAPDGEAMAGDWLFHIAYESENAEDVAAHFTAQGGRLEGTLALVSGDLGNLAGNTNGKSFSISRFDGIHILLLRAALQPDGSLKGNLLEPGRVVPFTATRQGAEAARMGLEAQAEQLTGVWEKQEPLHFSGVDLATGRRMTDADFAGKAVILDIFGTWCPNCHDEASLLADLQRRHQAEGLAVVGLAFEYTDDAARNRRVLGIFGKKYGLTFPLLLGGATGDVEKQLPQLVNFSSFPTTVFLDRHGRVHAIHAGFEGAATGQLEGLQARFEQLTREILK